MRPGRHGSAWPIPAGFDFGSACGLSDKPAGLGNVKLGVAETLTKVDRSLHAIRNALEDLEDHFECFLVSPLNFPLPLLAPGQSVRSCSCYLNFCVRCELRICSRVV